MGGSLPPALSSCKADAHAARPTGACSPIPRARAGVELRLILGAWTSVDNDSEPQCFLVLLYYYLVQDQMYAEVLCVQLSEMVLELV